MSLWAGQAIRAARFHATLAPYHGVLPAADESPVVAEGTRQHDEVVLIRFADVGERATAPRLLRSRLMTTSDGGSAERVNGITYVRIPAPDPGKSGAFYRAVFGWELRGDPELHLSFSDGTGDVIGAFVADRPVAGDTGVLPYIFVTDVEDTVARVTANGGRIERAPYPEPPDAEEHLTVATFRDPAGNVIGVWQTYSGGP